MSGNGKQVQLAQNQNNRFTGISTRSAPQRNDAFPVASGGVGGGYVPSNPTGGHHTMRGLPQAHTPPTPDINKQQMYPPQGNVRAQQYQQSYRPAPQQNQAGVGVVHHQQRPATHRQQGPGPAQTPTPAGWHSQPGMYGMPFFLQTHHVTMPPAPYPQQPTRPQYCTQPPQHPINAMMQQHHSPYLFNTCTPTQQPFMYNTGGAPGRSGPSPGQMTPAQSVPQQQQSHQFVSARYPSPMPHSGSTNEKKKRSHAIAIIDPKCGKEIDLGNNNEPADVQLPQEDSSITIEEDFSRHVSDAPQEKDDAETLPEEIICEPHIESGCDEPDKCHPDYINNISTDKSDMEYSDDNKVKSNQLCELNDTPVVSAISNSPEIVPKQCHITKQKQIESISNDNKKNQLTKIAIKLQNKSTSETASSEEISTFKVEMTNDSKEYIAQQILTSALLPANVAEEDINVIMADAHPLVGQDSQLPVEDLTAGDVTCETAISEESEKPASLIVTLTSNEVVPEITQQHMKTSSQKPKTESKKQKIPHSDKQDQAVALLKSGEADLSINVNISCTEIDSEISQDSNISESNKDTIIMDVVEGNFENLKLSNRNDESDISKDIIHCAEKDPVKVIDAPDDVNEDVANMPSEKNVLSDEKPVDISSVHVEDTDNKMDNQALEEKCEEKPKVPVLRYTYKDDQWSPLNTSGRKYYDTDFLLALKNDPNSKKRPENLIQSEILSDNLNRQPRNNDVTRPVAMSRNDLLLPGFVKVNAHNTTSNRKSQHGKPMKDSKGISVTGLGIPNRSNIIHVNLSLRSDVKLNESENAWKPSRIRQANLSDEEIQTEELCKKFRSVLNKLTPQNFDTLISQVRSLDIDTETRLSRVIDLVFEKAIDEPNFSYTYALMCKELATIALPSTEKSDVTFRTMIVKKCQNEFEKNDDTAKKMQKEIDECTDPLKSKEMVSKLEEAESRIRRRSVGNVRFAGELFKQSLIRPGVPIECIKHLLSKVEEESLECLCKFLTTIGKDLEKKHGQELQPYFNTMKSIVETKRKELSSRVRFMLQDVIDLRVNSWIPRQQVLKPKTIDQIKLEADLEHNKPAVYSTYGSPGGTSRKDDRPGNMNKRGGSRSTSDEVWLQAPSKGSKPKGYTVDSVKLSQMCSSTPVTETTLQPATFMWSAGSTVSKKGETVLASSHKPSHNSSSSTSKKPAIETSNSYLALVSQYSETPNSNMETPARKSGYKSKGASIERSTFKSDDSEEKAGNSSSELTNKIKDILAYAHSDTVFGMLDRIQSNIKNFDDIPKVCDELMIWGIEFKSKETMQIIGEVTGTLVDDDCITSNQFLKVLKETIDKSSLAFEKDGSLISKMLGAFIWAHMKKNTLQLEQIHTAFSNAIELGYGYNVLTAIFMEKLKESPNDIQMLWEKSNLTLEDWMDLDGVEQFSEEFRLKWIYQKRRISPEEACAQMLKQMQEGQTRDLVKAWIEENIDTAVQEAWFIRALTEAIHTYGLCCYETHKKPTLDSSRLEKYYPLLSTYIAGHDKQELECLFAIQRLINKHEHPQGITRQLFDYLWDCGDIISLEGITTWEKNDDPKEQEGKGVMLKTLTSFLTSIKSEEQSSDEANSILCEEEY